MNRGVMERQMFARGGAVRRMQAGGDPMMAPPMQDEMAMAPPPAGMPAPQEMPMDQAAQAAMQKGIDPGVLESLLQDAAGSFATLDAAENAGDYEQMINAIRGDQMPLQERRMELADLVGEADAAQTPDSVLTLVQPIMQIAAVDQGIGSMAPEVMETPVEGDMAGGIMSMVNMAEPEPSAEGSAPVNFERGGAVQYMQQGGVAMPVTPQPQTLSDIYGQRQALYSQILGQDNAQQEYEDQKRMTKAQMLFDIAQGGLMLASPADREMSPAERLAQAFTPVLGSISERAGKLEEFKQGQKREQRALNLQALSSAEATFAAQEQERAREELQEAANDFAASESRLDRAQEITLKNMDFDFRNADREDTQTFTEKLERQKFQNDIALLGLQGDQTQEAIQLRNRLEQDSQRLASNLRIAENQLAFENQLERDGILNSYELARMDKGHQFNLSLASHKGAIDQEAQLLQNSFTAAQNALDRAQRENLQLNDQTFRQLMQEDMQQFTSDQNEIDRAIAKVERVFNQEMANRKMALAERGQEFDEALETSKLSIAERAQALDEAYKMGMLTIEQMAADAEKLGSEAKTNTIQYLTNPERLDKYANGQLGDKASEFEQLVLDYISPKQNSEYDPKSAKYVQMSVKLAPRVLAAIKQGNPNFYSQVVSILGEGATIGVGGTQPAVGGTRPAAQGSIAQPQGQGAETTAVPRLSDATIEIMNPDGSINMESPAWEATPPSRFDPTIDYRRAIGASRIGPSVSAMGSEAYAEFTGGTSTVEAQNFREAQKTLTGLANDLLEFKTQLEGGRVLKFVQELIEKETENLRPGGFLLKTDAAASASLKALRAGIERGMRIEAQKLPEYGGDSSGYRENQVTAARANMDRMKELMNEILAFQRGFASPPQQPGPVGQTGYDQSTQSARQQILGFRRQNEGS